MGTLLALVEAGVGLRLLLLVAGVISLVAGLVNGGGSDLGVFGHFECFWEELRFV